MSVVCYITLTPQTNVPNQKTISNIIKDKENMPAKYFLYLSFVSLQILDKNGLLKVLTCRCLMHNQRQTATSKTEAILFLGRTAVTAMTFMNGIFPPLLSFLSIRWQYLWTASWPQQAIHRRTTPCWDRTISSTLEEAQAQRTYLGRLSATTLWVAWKR